MDLAAESDSLVAWKVENMIAHSLGSSTATSIASDDFSSEIVSCASDNESSSLNLCSEHELVTADRASLESDMEFDLVSGHEAEDDGMDEGSYAPPRARTTKRSQAHCAARAERVASRGMARASKIAAPSSLMVLSKVDKFEKVARSLLSELSARRAKTVSEKLAGLIKTLEHLSFAVEELCEIARCRHHLAGACADICARLGSDHRVDGIIGAAGNPVSFRQLVLNKCWPAFRQMLLVGSEIFACGPSRGRAAMVGNVRLIGELILRDVVSPRLVIEMSEAMLQGSEACIEMLEPLAGFLSVVGGPYRAKSQWIYTQRFIEILDRVDEFSQSSSVPSDLKCRLREMLGSI